MPPDPMAFDALTVEEEEHLFFGNVHLALAAKCREKTLRRKGASTDEVDRARQAYECAWEELSGMFVSKASRFLVENKEIRPLLFAVPDPRCDPELLFQMLRICPLGRRVCDPEILADRETMLEAVQEHPWGFRYLDDALKADKELVLAAIAADALTFPYASAALREDREVVMEAVRSQTFLDITVRNYGSNILDSTTPEMQNDKEIILAAVRTDGWALAHASDSLKGDRDVVLAALQKQTVGDIANCSAHNVIELAGGELKADKEIVLEAVRVQGSAVEHAHAELRRDKDFLLQAARRAPAEQRDTCYAKADPGIRDSITLGKFLGAAESALALPGDSAPVLHVDLASVGSAASTFEVTLLSGASFACNVPSGSESPDAEPQKAGEDEANAGQEPPKKRPKTTEAEPQNGLTTAGLANAVRAGLQEKLQVDPLPDRVFIVFAKGGDDGDHEGVPITPWDWDRPVSDFL